ncbi:unnamed protein product, partial [marine sediment metagenome]
LKPFIPVGFLSIIDLSVSREINVKLEEAYCL